MSEQLIRFTLERNNFKKGIFYGYIVPNKNEEISSIVRCVVPWVHPDDIDDVMNHVGREILRHLRSGNRVTFGDYMVFEPVIEGVFRHEEDIYDPSRHSLGVKVLTGGLLKELNRDERVRVRRIKGIRRRHSDRRNKGAAFL
jgi:hypothetical protein